jgi:hypothetical protein
LSSSTISNLEVVSNQVSFIAFMMYHRGDPLRNLSNYTKRLEKLKLPFKLGRLQSQNDAKLFEGVFQSSGYQGEIIFISSGEVNND